ncbi:autotransporter outer membrane beta-barrel domain-containing protein [Sandarakinorhabdus rubra]|uniref:autotransporter outer membrane beta-barrel domain-containing protein n=1 Tax=Sandarakinorhabdus rubra TaxID=2672568 RepID=UPI0013DB24A1|nr:autotransporter outer membrane beta-barrel domain-containing protein [Sandarakinorhabdus rubra]
MVKRVMVALLALAAAPALAQANAADDSRPWTLSASGGITAIQAQADQPFVGLGLRRDFGSSWVKLEGTWVGSGDARGATIPADTWIGTLSAGTYVGNLGLDAYVSAGRRSFDGAALRGPGGQAITVDRSGSIFGVGGSISYDLALSERLFLTPFVGADYNNIDFAAALTGPGGGVIGSQRQSSDGITGSAGVSLAHLFANDGGSIGLSAAVSTASNIAAVGQVGFVNRPGANTPRFADIPNEGGSWGELGASLSLNASKAVAIDLSVIQTVSFPFGDTTAGIVGLRFRF